MGSNPTLSAIRPALFSRCGPEIKPWDIRLIKITEQLATFRPEKASPSRLLAEVFLKLVDLPLIRESVGGRDALHCDVGPKPGVFRVDLQPFAVRFVLGIGLDGVNWTFGFADAAINAVVWRDDQKVLALVEAIHRADFDTVHELAFHAGVGDEVGHERNPFLVAV